MAEARISVDQFICPVCLDLLKDPVTTSCGHSYCKICITDCWDQEDEKRVYSCPQCRQTFSPRPALGKNTMLAEVVEKLKKTKLPADCYAGAGDVQCDVCPGRKYKAVKSCLLCRESYCQTHFHEESHSRKPHKVIDATGRLQDMICCKHDKELEMFCITDQRCICVLCKEYEHKNHNTVSTAAQRTEKQKQLKETQMKIRQIIQQRQKDLQQLREAVESHKRSAQTAVKDSEKIFTELIRSIERSRSEVTQLIRDQEKAAVSRAEGRLERLEQEINDLRRRDAELEQLSHTHDHIHFLQSFQSLSAPPKSTDKPDDPFRSLFSFDGMRESVRLLRDKLEDFCKEEIKKISDRVTFTSINPKTRNDFLQYSHQLTLDLNTVNKHLYLSEKIRTISGTDIEQPYPDHPDRFDQWWQVLCRESVWGRCYWEIEWSGVYGVFISVSYKSISRKGEGNEGLFGGNNQSWSLYCSSYSYSFMHNKIQTVLPVAPISRRIGVYVDHSAGTLSFYSVSDTMSLIHTVQTTFTQLLYPGCMVCVGSSVKLCWPGGTPEIALPRHMGLRTEEVREKEMEGPGVTDERGERGKGKKILVWFPDTLQLSPQPAERLSLAHHNSPQQRGLFDSMLLLSSQVSAPSIVELLCVCVSLYSCSKMAEARISQDEFTCPVCLDLLKDPVTTSCGHSFCKSCITGCWDQEDERRVYSCPQCRQTFSPRPALGKNTMLAEVVEKLKKTKLPADCYAGAGDVQCDVCPGRKYKAVKSCLLCQESYCQTHFHEEFHSRKPHKVIEATGRLQDMICRKQDKELETSSRAGDVQCDVCPGRKYRAVKSCLLCRESYCQTHFHEESHSRKPHKVIEATGRLQDMICCKHDKELEMYCVTDQQCICVLCKEYEHKNHNTVSTAAQRTEKQNQLKETQMKIRQIIQQRQKDLQQLREAVESHKRSAQTAVKDSEKIFTELICSIERSCSEVTQLIRDQEKAAVSRAEGRLKQLEQEINDLRRRDAELEQLSHTHDHIHFLQSFQSLSAPPKSTDEPDDPSSSLFSFDGMRESVRLLRDKLEDFCKEEIKKISDRVTFTNMNPKTRNDFLQYSHQFTLDLNTVNKTLYLSEKNRVITFTYTVQPYPEHPDRFDGWSQVLCRESVCGRCYWEIDWSGNYVFISVSYKSISRKGGNIKCAFGYNDQSWSLDCTPSKYSFRHNNIETVLPIKSISHRIGVFVDHSAGTLSFYSVSDTMSLIHTVQTTFTQPLYPGFNVWSGSSVKLC
ncbi:uncharacterized protein LOC125250461 [Megalobrama amblycephala]|uniref:uncharacterized protein LOC125250461 n=1 Tax=Megalobrama amblycephala TaxID=75352 RepID=UPI0020144172|nr:uncharacterized protein LOC125250461 [Megalobrama amblycephala]